MRCYQYNLIHQFHIVFPPYGILLIGLIHLICNHSDSQVIQTQLIAQSDEDGTKFEVSMHQVLVLRVIPCEYKLRSIYA